MLQKITLVFMLTVACFAATAQKKQDTKKYSNQVISEATRRQFDYYFFEAIRLREEKKLDQAMELFQLCASIDSTDAGCHSELGNIYSQMGLRTEAIESLEKAVKYAPKNWWYNNQLISILSTSKIYKKGEEQYFYNNLLKAVDIAKKLQKIYPNKADSYRVLGALYSQLNWIEKSIEAFDQLEKVTDVSIEISLIKYQLYMMVSKPKKAFNELDKIVNKYPSESRYKTLRADQYLAQKQAKKAFDYYQEILKTEPENPFVFSSLAKYYTETKELDKAKEYIIKALKSDELEFKEKTSILKDYLEPLLKDTANIKQIESLIKLLVEKYPLEEDIHGYYASFLEYTKRKSEAKLEYETMLTINPTNEAPWFKLLLLASDEKDYITLKNITSRALEVISNNPLLNYYNGMANYQTADYQEAVNQYQKGLTKLKPEHEDMKSEYYEQLGDAYYKLNEKEKCFESYEKALLIDPKNISVMNNYAYYLSEEKKDLKRAEKMSAKTVELNPKNSTFLDTYAWILYQQGNYSLAKFYIERAVENLETTENNGVVFEHYGDILWMLKTDDSKAIDMWQKAFNLGEKSDNLKLKIENKGWKRN
jgi:tetratricopeptide (TPR) repeat protein